MARMPDTLERENPGKSPEIWYSYSIGVQFYFLDSGVPNSISLPEDFCVSIAGGDPVLKEVMPVSRSIIQANENIWQQNQL